MMFILFLGFLPCLFCFTVEFPFKTNFMARIKDINLRKLDQQTTEDLQFLFKTTPVLVFENQDLIPEEQFYICTLFDKYHNTKKCHPFHDTQIDSVEQIALRGKGLADRFGVKSVPIYNGRQFLFTPLWHQDLVGVKDVNPSVVSSMYMIKTPPKGGETKFASLENAYDNMSFLDRSLYGKLNSVYSHKLALLPQMDFTGYGKLYKYWEEAEFTEQDKSYMVSQPLVVYADKETTRKSLMLTPNKLYHFENTSFEKSQEIVRYIMQHYVLTPNNVGSLKYREKDLAIFNNRKVIHTSSPTAEYDEDRLFSLLFLGTDLPILPINK